MSKLPVLIAIALGFVVSPAPAEAVKDREGAVRGDKAAMENDARWIYNDYERGFAEAKQSGKPLLVVLRCVPCLACMGIDASVLNEPALAPLLDQFVCVRLINANALDLTLFQFDYDLSFSTIIFNADRTVYGRYGSWTHQKNAFDKTTDGFKRALEAALQLHRDYPANKQSLDGKQGNPTPYKNPLELPTIAGKYELDLNWEGKVVQSCVHCHQIGDAFRVSYREKKQPLPTNLIYPWPAPETIGFSLAPDHVARVASVTPNSPAAKAGLAPGDDLVALAGQPLISIADVSWALHHAPDAGSIAASVKRNGAIKPVTIALPQDWRRKSDIARRVATWPMRAMAAGGMSLEDLSDAERERRGIAKNQMALFVKGLGQFGKHAAAKNAGFQKEDVIVRIAGFSQRLTEGELLGHLLQKHMVGEKIPVTVQRGSQRLTLSLPMQ